MKVYFSLNWDGVSATTWTDYSNYVDVSKFKRTISLNNENDPTKAVTAEIEAFGSAYTAINTNFVTSINRYSNFYVIRIEDTECGGNYYYFKIEDKQLRWCDNGECKIMLTLLEYSLQLDCIKKTTIGDNTNSEFQAYPSSGYPHPRFRYCDVVKPTFIYGMLVTVSNGFTLLIQSINLVIASITGIIVWIVNHLGGSWNVPQLGFGWAADLLGCNRGHPAPFVRTYIDNVCTLCNLNVYDTTAPILYDYAANTNNYYWMCLATAYTTKGVDMDGGKDYIPANQPSWDLGKFLSLLKTLFNARWFIYNDLLYFERKDLIGELIWGSTPALNLSGADAVNLLGDVCYTYNGEGKPKTIIFNYGTDPSDNIGNELLRRFRCIYNDSTGNANYTDKNETTLYEFGASSCVMDGKDSAYDENIANALAGTIPGTAYEGCLKTQGDTFALAKLLLYNQATPMNDARCDGSAYDVYGSVGADILSFSDDDANYILTQSSDCKNYNFPFSFDPDADNVSGSGFRNLWQFHLIDLPSPSKQTHLEIDFTLQYCCTYNSLNLFQTVVLKDGVTEAEIFEINFDHSDKREITIKAKLK
jgi:hypothetical protein